MSQQVSSTATSPPSEASPPRWPWPFTSPVQRPGWKQLIAESGLPSQIQALLVQVVGETRLLADEKLEVAQELVAHFEDGLQRGRSVAALIAAFGDPQMAADLIHHGKQRNRSMKNRIIYRLIQAALGLGALTVGAFLALFILFYWGQPKPSVDYQAQINQPILAAADQDKGWTIYRDLWIKHGFSEGGRFDTKALFLPEEAGGLGRLVRPGDGEAWQAATERLAGIEDLLEGFREGGLRPAFGVPLYIRSTDYEELDFRALFPHLDYQAATDETQTADPVWPETLVSILLPHVQVMRQAARLLIVDTRWALDQGDSERATRNIEAMLGISVQVTEGDFLVSTLVGYAIQLMAMDVIDECLHSTATFSDSQLERMHAAVSKAKSVEMVNLEQERAMFLDIVQKSYTDDGRGDGRITAAGLELWEEVSLMNSHSYVPRSSWSFESVTRRALAPTSLLFLASRKQLTDKAEEFYTRMGELIKADNSETEMAELEREIDQLPIGYTPIKLLFPAFTQIRQSKVRVRLNTDSVSAALAVIRYQRQHGRWPDSLDDLVANYLERVPIDPYDGQPLRYRLQDEGFVIYSVGVNGVDDGGQAVMLDPDGSFVSDLSAESDPDALRPLPAGAYIPANNYPGDWILWPRLSGKGD
jgi:hypothetical protein